jgi:hypothetical protein
VVNKMSQLEWIDEGCSHARAPARVAVVKRRERRTRR